MNEQEQKFSPANMILAHRNKLEKSLLQLQEQAASKLELIVEEKIIQPLVKLIKTTNSKALERTKSIHEKHQGKSGYTPRAEKHIAVRKILTGLSYRLTKEDHQEREVVVAEESNPEEVSIHLIVDSGPTLRGNQEVKKILTVLRMINELSPEVLNVRQNDTVIKKIHLSVDVLLGTIDGNKIVHLGKNLSTNELLSGYVKQLDATIYDVDPSRYPRMRYLAKIADVLRRSREVADAELQEPHMIHHHAILFVATQYFDGVPFQFATEPTEIMLV